MNKLPKSFYVETVRRESSFRLHVWYFVLVALASAWMLFDLPGAPLHVLRLPEDMPNFGFGLNDIFIEDDGTWIIKRSFYADRMSRYEIDAAGSLERFRGSLRERNPEMESRRRDRDSIVMPEGTMPRIRTGRRYLRERADLRKQHIKTPLREEPGSRTPEQAAIAKAELEKEWEEPYVIVMTYGVNDVRAHLLLKDYSHYAVIDSWTFRHPSIWVTTDKLKYLHRIHATDVGGGLVIKEQQTVPLNLGFEPQFAGRLGFDKHSGQVFLLTHNGQRFWFDPQTLQQVKHEQLPGMWEREYAAVGFMTARPGFPQYAIGYGRVGGWALTEPGYLRLLRGLTVTFIASLLLLALELLKAWRSTSERTTAVTS